MTDWVELLLVDGPGAGKRIQRHSDFTTYMHVSYPDLALPTLSFGSPEPTMTFAGPTHTPYRVGHAYGLDRQIVRVGWSSGKPEPDPEELEYWLRYEPSIKVVAGADAYPFGCDFGIRKNQVAATVQGACRCGWETEAVPPRRMGELMELVAAHRKISTATGFGRDAGALEFRSISQATRYEACLIRAEAVGISQIRASEIFRKAEAAVYSFDEAIEYVEDRIRRFAMYGYMPLAVRDVLTRREVDTHQADPEAILNRPRWMPDPLGRQFAEMSRDRQRSLVTAALAVTDELGGDAAGWPLERALAAVMPFQEDARV